MARLQRPWDSSPTNASSPCSGPAGNGAMLADGAASGLDRAEGPTVAGHESAGVGLSRAKPSRNIVPPSTAMANTATTAAAATPDRCSQRRDSAERTQLCSAALPGVRPATTRYSATGSAMPFRRRRPRGRKLTSRWLRVRARTVSLTSSSPGSACAQMRAATLTAPLTMPSAQSSASPAWIPIPTRTGCAVASADGSAAASRMAKPARTAWLTESKTT